jgi:hypothetical protein
MRVLVSLLAAAAITATLAQKPLGPTPVVVELFTSQGCSSCPPADELIRTLARDSSLRGKVIPLAFHVDYWDRLGWRDPFSSAEWTRRQFFYVRALNVNSAFTPQAVVNGGRQFVGSHAPAMTEAIQEASHRTPLGHVRVDATRDGNHITARVHADAQSGTDVLLVLFQNDVTTRIGAGENDGRSATEDAIVRQLVRVGSGTVDKSVTLTVDPSWKKVGVAAFLQNHDTLTIGNATSVILSEAKDLR